MRTQYALAVAVVATSLGCGAANAAYVDATGSPPKTYLLGDQTVKLKKDTPGVFSGAWTQAVLIKQGISYSLSTLVTSAATSVSFGLSVLEKGQGTLGSVTLLSGLNSVNLNSLLSSVVYKNNEAKVQLVFSATAQSKGTATFGDAQLFSSVAAVPGPIAGAGLPALLSLAGYGAWRRRKQATN